MSARKQCNGACRKRSRSSPVTSGTLGGARLERLATTGEVGGNLTVAGGPEGMLVHYMTNQHAMQLQQGAYSPIADRQVCGQQHGRRWQALVCICSSPWAVATGIRLRNLPDDSSMLLHGFNGRMAWPAVCLTCIISGRPAQL